LHIVDSLVATVEEAGSEANAPTQIASAIEDLLVHYRAVERRALCLPSFSFEPFLRFSGLAFVLYFFATFNLYIAPLNALIWCLKKLGLRVPYVWIARRRVREAWTWVRRGEAALIPFVVIRPWTIAMVRVHFRRRLILLRRRLVLEPSFSDEERNTLVAKIDDGLELWQGLSVAAAVWTYGVQAIGVSTAFTFATKIEKLGTGAAVGTAIGLLVVLVFAATPFMVKRGLMLGGSGSESYFPGLLDGTGVYGIERRVFLPLGIVRNEFPIDISLSYLFAVAPIVAALAGSSALIFLASLWPFVGLSTYALLRRRRVGRW
jgi:hypothetical protein